MANYKGIRCPVCDEVFKIDDDIVVCPDCGTPHHRGCYGENCKNVLLHSENYVWKSPIENAIQSYKAIEESEISRINETDDKIREEGKDPENDIRHDFFEIMNDVRMRDRAFREHQKRFETQDIYGVSEKEIMVYTGSRTGIEGMRYRKISESKYKISLNVFAGLISPLYQFYMRDRLLGFILSVTQLPSVFAYIYTMYSSALGLSFQSAGGFETSPFSPLFTTLVYYLNLFITIAVVLFYDYFHLKFMARRIKSIRSKYIEETGEDVLDDDYYVELASRGRPSFLRMLADTGVLMIVIYVLSRIIITSMTV